jgi:hypothetical protein
MSRVANVSKDDVKARFAKAPAKSQKSLVQQTIELLQKDFRDAEDIVSVRIFCSLAYVYH